MLLQTYHIHINGIVQGTGFRPFVYQLANEMLLNGYVKNGNDGVHVYFNALPNEAEIFFKRIQQEAPAKAKLMSANMQWAGNVVFAGFSIMVDDENSSRAKKVLLTPDRAVCPACKSELHDKNNRRYRYPFVTCAQCGPRYSIINAIPYERHGTSMRQFFMCEDCNDEYSGVADTRFFSQTNSCGACGVRLRIWQDGSRVLSKSAEEVLQHIKNFLDDGKIVAVKGIGGYLLMCCAANADTIQLLRNRKNRPSKPFAVLYPGIEAVGNDFVISDREKELLESGEAPIVLLCPLQNAFDQLAVQNIAPGLNRIGVMLPYSPLLELIAADYGKPLIATSANISGSPIIFKDKDALTYLFDIADYVVSYNREIVVPQDDSVVQVTPHANRQIILRRSRGYAPSFLQYAPHTKQCVAATGAFLKSSFTLAINGNIFVSQFLGSGESYEAQQMYMHTLEHWLKLYAVKPGVILTDKHGGYFSHQYAVELAAKYGVPVQFIQHHEGHFAAVLAENNLIKLKEPVLGIIWDGTGLGSDGNIWGGEFFKYENNQMLRCYHFDYFPAIAGDKMALEPRIAAICAASDAWPRPALLKQKFTDAEWNNYQSLINNTTLFSSSVGRIFDAVASLLDVCDKQTHEGEAAMYVQVLAESYIGENGFVMDCSYFKEGSHYYRIPTATLIQGIVQDVAKGKANGYIAAKFHYSLVSLIGIVAHNLNVDKICFSGGVFQNALLVDWIEHEYSNKYELYFHKNLPPNDENISFGQMVYFDNGMVSVSNTPAGDETAEQEIMVIKTVEIKETKRIAWASEDVTGNM